MPHATRIFRTLVYGLLLASHVLAPTASADANKVGAPAQLEAWRSWILHQHPDLNCSQGPARLRRNCHWVSPLALDVTKTEIKFSQTVRLETDGWSYLPGSNTAWPTLVIVNNKPAKVMRHTGKPALFLTPATYNISGKISQNHIPLSIQLPATTTFVDLSINGKKINQPSIDEQTLFLNRLEAKQTRTNESMNVQVFRLLKDGYPLTLESKLVINVSGEQRIATLGRVLPEGFELTRIGSTRPLRINAAGDMEIQLEAGEHVVKLTARAKSPLASFEVSARSNWPKEELWSFAPDRRFRIVDVTGSTIDGNQTNMPDAWLDYSTYLLTPQQGLQLTEKSRGDINPDKHVLSLNRTLWLNFAGDGFTSEEEYDGTLGYLDRISASANYRAGRIAINDRPALITSVNNDQGIEVLPGDFTMESVGQLDGNQIAVSPWLVDLNEAKLRINLPPGFSMFAVKGADAVSNTYLSSWSLWQIFVLILLVVVLTKQYSIAAGTIGLLYGLSTHNIADAPSILMLLIIVGLHFAVLSITIDKLRTLLNYTYRAAVIIVVLAFLPFAVDQARLSIYPQLENPYDINATSRYQSNFPDRGQDRIESEADYEMIEEVIVTAEKKSYSGYASKPQKFKRYQQNEVVQTGPGLPQWNWNYVDIRMTGPVLADQKVTLFLTPPWATRILNLLRVILFLALAYFVMRKQNFKLPSIESPDTTNTTNTTSNGLAALCLVFLFTGFSSDDLSASDFPSPELLETYYQRLDAQAECMPDCVAINQLLIDAKDNKVVLQFAVSALARAPLALPIDLTTLRSVDIKVNGKSSHALTNNNNQAYLLVEKGSHDVTLSINTEQIQQLIFQFQQTPQITRIKSKSWRATGIENLALPSKRIALNKIKKQTISETRLAPAPIEVFVRVKRELKLDIDWTIYTTVTRVAPNSGAFSVSIPLIEGESVTSPGLKVTDGELALNFSDNTTSLFWQSNLERVSPIQLNALSSTNYYEVWQLQPSTRWHATYEGLVPSKTNADKLLWQPMTGESLAISLQRPTPLEGVSRSIDAVTIKHNPGKRQTKTSLSMDFRASQGSDFPITLPDQAQISSISQNGQNIIYQETAGKIVLPVPPGESHIVLHWSENTPMSVFTHTPSFKLAEATNINIETTMPENRWVLAVAGPMIGPAVLFWGVLMVILAIGFGLGRLAWSPLKSWQWMLMGTGIATSFWPITLILVVWFYALAKRDTFIHAETPSARFRLVQLGIALLSIVMLAAVVWSVANSLMFGSPDMQVIGNGSYAHLLRWYQDTITSELPTTTVVSLPMWVYKILMLLWSIWLSISLIGWLRWGWVRYTENGIWKSDAPNAPEASKRRHNQS